MFRVKIQVPKELASQYIERIKTGVRGVGYVKVTRSAVWPAWLQNLRGARHRQPALVERPPEALVHGVTPRLAEPLGRIRPASRWSRSRTSPTATARCVALDGISLDIPPRPHGRHRRPRRRRQVDAHGADRRLQEDAAGDGDRPRRRHRRRPAPARRGPADRLHAAGPGQEPLSGAQRPRQRRLHGAAVRAVAPRSARSASRSCSRPPGSARSPIARPASSRAA